MADDAPHSSTVVDIEMHPIGTASANGLEIPPDYEDDEDDAHSQNRQLRRYKRHSLGDARPGTSANEDSLRQRHSYHHNRQPSNQGILDQLPSKQKLRRTASTSDTATRTKAKKVAKTKSSYATIRLRHGEQIDTNEVAQDLLSDPSFAAEPSELQTDNIKELATNISNKREIKYSSPQVRLDSRTCGEDYQYQEFLYFKRTNFTLRLVAASDRRQIQGQSTLRREGKDKNIGCWKQTKYSMALSWKRFKVKLAEVMYSLELWRGHMKKIEGKFGTSVTTYFLFLKWLLLVNLPLFVFSFSLIVIPQIVYRFLEAEPSGYVDSSQFTGKEILTGGDWFLDTELYYGTYLNGTIEALGGLSYDMQWAYLLVSITYYLLTLIIVMSSLTSSYKTNYIQGNGAESFYYVSKVLVGWDHKLTSDNAAQLKQKSLFKELQEYVKSLQNNSGKKRTCSAWCGLILFRVFTNIIAFGLIGGSGYLVWYIFNSQSLKNDLELLNELALPMTISAMNYILPFAFSILATFERYSHPRYELFLTMIRTILLNAVTLGVLLASWLIDIECVDGDEVISNTGTSCQPCWENFMGQQIYQLVIMDFVFILLLTLFSEVFRRVLSQYCLRSLGHPEFNIGRNTLYLIYSQTLVWLGAFYSPILPVITIIKVIIVFYVKRLSVMTCCDPSVKPWRAARTHTIMLGFVLLALLLSFVAIIYSIGFITPSDVCGPYTGFNSSFDIITNKFEDFQDNTPWFAYVVIFITSTEFLAVSLIALCVAAYYMSVMSKGLNDMVELLKKQIKLEGEDKTFLLRLLQQAGGGKSPVARSHVPITRYATAEQLGGAPTPQGGKKFSRAIYDAAGGTPSRPGISGTPHPSADMQQPAPPQEAPKASITPGGPARPSLASMPGSTYIPGGITVQNPAFADHSLDHPSDGSGRGVPRDLSNPAFHDRSPQLAHRPNLPYPAQHYDIVRPKTDQS